MAPAPTTVCSSSMKVTTWPSLPLISSRTALSRSSNSPRYFAPGDHRAEVEGHQPLAAQRLGDVAGDDALRQTLDDGGLADTGLADEDRVVLGAPGQHLDDPTDLGVAADDRVDRALARTCRQVDAVLLQRLEAALRVGAGHAGVAAQPGQRLEQRRIGGAVPGQQVGDVAADRREAEQQVLGRQVRVAAGRRPLLGVGQDPLQGPGRLRAGDGAARQPAAAGRRRSRRQHVRPAPTHPPRRAAPRGCRPAWSSSASRRWAGSSWGLPSRTARCCAAEIASWVLLVRSIASLSGRSASAVGSPDDECAAALLALQLGEAAAQPVDLGLEGEHPADALEVDALVGEPLDLAELGDVAQRVAAPAACGAAGRDQAEPVVLAQGLGVQPADLGSDRDDVDRRRRRSGRTARSSGSPLAHRPAPSSTTGRRAGRRGVASRRGRPRAPCGPRRRP